MNSVIGPVGMAGHDNEGMEWMREHRGFPYIDWKVFRDEISAGDRRAESDAIDLWLDELREALGDWYEIVDCESAVAVSGIAADDTDRLLIHVERACARLKERLPGIVVTSVRSKPVLLLFENPSRAHEYFEAMDEGDGERLGELATFMTGRVDRVLFAPAPAEQHQGAILHAFTHVMTDALLFPYWVREMVAVYATEAPAPPPLDAMEKPAARAFLNGKAFFDDKAREASLARVGRLAHALSTDYDAFRQFVRTSDWRDGGEAAARAVFGVAVADLINR
jgi:hypothetical protein